MKKTENKERQKRKTKNLIQKLKGKKKVKTRTTETMIVRRSGRSGRITW